MSLDPGRIPLPAAHVCRGRVGFSPDVHVFTGLPPQAICGAGELYARMPGAFDVDDPDGCLGCRDALGSADRLGRDR